MIAVILIVAVAGAVATLTSIIFAYIAFAVAGFIMKENERWE